MREIGMADLAQMEQMGFRGNMPDRGVALHWFRGTGYESRDIISTRDQRHPFFELHMILKGGIHYLLGEEEIWLEKGGLLVLPPDTPHRIASYTPDFFKFSVAFSVEEKEPLYAALCACGKGEITEEMQTRLYILTKDAARNDAYAALLIGEGLFGLLCLVGAAGIQKTTSSPPSGRAKTADPRVTRAKAYIAQRPAQLLRCAQVAAACHLSAKQLGRLFEREEGMSLLAYIHREKIAMAKKMLAQGDLSRKEISDALGFSGEYYFSRFFKMHTGMTPGAYQRSEGS